MFWLWEDVAKEVARAWLRLSFVDQLYIHVCGYSFAQRAGFRSSEQIWFWGRELFNVVDDERYKPGVGTVAQPGETSQLRFYSSELGHPKQ